MSGPLTLTGCAGLPGYILRQQRLITFSVGRFKIKIYFPNSHNVTIRLISLEIPKNNNYRPIQKQTRKDVDLYLVTTEINVKINKNKILNKITNMIVCYCLKKSQFPNHTGTCFPN